MKHTIMDFFACRLPLAAVAFLAVIVSQTFAAGQALATSPEAIVADSSILLPQVSRDNYNRGFRDGYQEGHIDGTEVGKLDCKTRPKPHDKTFGPPNSYNQGFADGYPRGYEAGYAQYCGHR